MTISPAVSIIIPFHRRNSPVANVTAYAFHRDDAVLIRLTDGTSPRTEGYCFVSYCPKHEAAWSPRDFGVCPLCDPDVATRRQVK